jgi:hypothetical protein
MAYSICRMIGAETASLGFWEGSMLPGAFSDRHESSPSHANDGVLSDPNEGLLKHHRCFLKKYACLGQSFMNGYLAWFQLLRQCRHPSVLKPGPFSDSVGPPIVNRSSLSEPRHELHRFSGPDAVRRTVVRIALSEMRAMALGGEKTCNHPRPRLSESNEGTTSVMDEQARYG